MEGVGKGAGGRRRAGDVSVAAVIICYIINNGDILAGIESENVLLASRVRMLQRRKFEPKMVVPYQQAIKVVAMRNGIANRKSDIETTKSEEKKLAKSILYNRSVVLILS